MYRGLRGWRDWGRGKGFSHFLVSRGVAGVWEGVEERSKQDVQKQVTGSTEGGPRIQQVEHHRTGPRLARGAWPSIQASSVCLGSPFSSPRPFPEPRGAEQGPPRRWAPRPEHEREAHQGLQGFECPAWGGAGSLLLNRRHLVRDPPHPLLLLNVSYPRIPHLAWQSSGETGGWSPETPGGPQGWRWGGQCALLLPLRSQPQAPGLLSHLSLGSGVVAFWLHHLRQFEPPAQLPPWPRHSIFRRFTALLGLFPPETSFQIPFLAPLAAPWGP